MFLRYTGVWVGFRVRFMRLLVETRQCALRCFRALIGRAERTSTPREGQCRSGSWETPGRILPVASLLMLAISLVSSPEAIARSATIASVKTVASPLNPAPGDLYTLSVRATGTTGSPCSATFIASIPGVPSLGSQSATRRIHSGQPQQFAFSFLLPGSLANGTSLTPSLTWSGCGSGSGSGLPPGTTPPTVASAGTPGLDISKVLAGSGATDVTPGDIVTYRLTVSSVGTADAQNVTLTDALDGDLEFVSADSPGSHAGGTSGGTVTWNLGTLSPGDSRSYELTTRVSAGASPWVISNQAQVSADAVGTRTTAPVDVTVHTEPKITLLKTINDDSTRSAVLEAGRQVTYRIRYSNVGPGPASNLVVTDNLPTQFIGPYSLTGGASSSVNTTTGIATWNVGTVLPGESRVLTITGQIDPGSTSQDFDNVADASYENAASTQFTSTSPEAHIAVLAEPYVTISKEVTPAVVAPGDTLFYTVRFRNIGSVTATDPVITDTLPPNVTLVPNSAVASYDAGTRTLTWDTLADLDPSSRESSVTYQVTVDAGTSDNTKLVNEVDFTASNLPGFISAVAQASAQVQGKPVLLPQKAIESGSSLVDDGSRVTYRLSVANLGVEATDGGVTITDRLVPGLDFVSARGPGTCSYAASTVTCTATDLLPGASSGSFLLTVEVDGSQWQDGDVIPNALTATAQDQYGRSFSETSPPVLLQYNLPPTVSITKTASPDVGVPLQPGDIVTYFIAATLDTVAGVSNLVILDALPPELEFVDASDPGVTVSTNPSGGTLVSWPAQALPAGARLVSLRARVRDTVVPGQSLTNQTVALWGTNSTSQAPPVTHYVNDAAMSLSKTVGQDQLTLVENEIVTYTLTASNTGTIPLTGMRLVDALPSGVTYLDALPSPTTVISGANTTVDWALPNLNPGASHPITVRARVNGGTTGTILRNSAFLVANEVQPESAFIESTVRDAPALQIAKSVSKSTVHPGDTVEYNLIYSNTGTGDAVNVELYDQFPPGLTFISASDGKTPDGNGNLVWNIGTLKRGDSGSKVVRAVVPNIAYPTPTPVDNLAFILSDKDGTADQASTTIVELPAFTVTKSVSAATASPGDVLRYTIDVAKTGGAAASVILSDSLAPNVAYVAGSASSALDAGSDPANRFLRWNLGAMPAGAGTFSVSFDVQLDSVIRNGTVIDNTAHLFVSGLAGQDSNTVTTTVSSAPVLTLSKSASATNLFSAVTGNPDGYQSDTVTFTLEAENVGNDVATNVVLEDRLPDELTILSVSQSGAANGQLLRWNLGNISPGKTATATVTARLDNDLASGTLLRNQALLSTSNAGIGTVLSNQVLLTVRGEPLLELSKTASAVTPKPGDHLTYTLVIENVGTGDSGAIVIEDQLPSVVSFVSATGGGAETAAGSGVVRWNLPALSAGDSHTVSVEVELDAVIPDGTALNNLATAHEGGNTGTSVTSTPAGPVPVVSSAPFLTIAKANESGATLPAGSEVSWRIVVTNSGGDAANGLIITDQLSPQMTLVNASKGYNNSGSTVSWSLNTLPAKSSATYTLTTRISDNVANGKALANTASVSSSEQPLPRSSTARVKVLAADLSLTKSADRAYASAGASATSTPGDEVTYTLNFRNTGGASASTVTVEDVLPADLVYLDANPAPSSVNGQVLRWQFADVPPQGGGSIAIRTRVDDDLRNGLVLHNTASVSAPGIPATGATPVDVIVSSEPRLTLDKTSAVSTAVPGQTVSFDLTVRNLGSDVAQAVTVSDSLPSQYTIIGTTAGASVAGNTVTWNLGTLDPGDTAALHIKAELAGVLPDGLAITNTATLTGENASAATLPSVSESHTIVISSAPVLQINYVAQPTYVAPGGSASWTLRVSNTGNSIANGVEVAAILPSGIQPVAVDRSGTFQTDLGTGFVYAKWSIGSLPPAGYIDLTFTGSLPIGVATDTPLLSLAAIEGTNAPPEVTLATALAAGSPALQLTKSALGSVEAGGTLDYRLDYFNAGNVAATNVQLADLLPPNVSFVSADVGGTLTGGVVEWSLGSVPALSGGSVNVRVAVDGGLINGTALGNLASVAADNNPPIVANALTLVRSHTELDVGIDPASAVVNAGGDQVFTVTWGNSGNQNTNNALLTATLPPNTTFVSASDGGTLSGGQVQWPAIATLSSGQTGSYSFTVRTDDPLANGTKLKSVATIAPGAGQPGLPDTATAVFGISSEPVILASKSVSTAAASVGDTVTFDIRFQNVGNEDATGAVVSDTLPAELEFVSATGGGSYDDVARRVSWNVGTLAALSAEQQFTVTARIVASSQNITNAAVVTTTEVPNQPLSASLSAVARPPVPVTVPVPVLGGRFGWALLALMLLLLAYSQRGLISPHRRR